MSEQVSLPEQFWGSEPSAAWSASIAFPEGGIPRSQFEETMVAAAEELDHRYTGFITLDPSTGNVTSFTRTIYPRRKYPVTPPEECAEGLSQLATAFGTVVVPDVHQSDSFRAVLGLQIGQQDTYNTPPAYAVDDVQAHLLDRTQGSSATLAEVFTVRFSESGTTTYTEPVAVVTGPIADMRDVCLLGVDLGQERFTLERYDDGHAPVVQMIETVHCQEPEFVRPQE